MSKKTSVLYVDDEDTLRFLVDEQLTAEGFSVETADDGDTAVTMLGNKDFDVILLDIKMPRMNGMEVLKHLKQKKIKSRIVMLTGVDDMSIALEAVKNGANDYLTKPFDQRNLVKAIQRVTAK